VAVGASLTQPARFASTRQSKGLPAEWLFFKNRSANVLSLLPGIDRSPPVVTALFREFN